MVTAIYECLAGDDEAQFVIMALADGKKEMNCVMRSESTKRPMTTP
jgi:hypothetical protein